MATWICNKCGEAAELTDVDTMMGEFDGVEEAQVCNNCKDWWFVNENGVIPRMVKGERDCEAKMA